MSLSQAQDDCLSAGLFEVSIRLNSLTKSKNSKELLYPDEERCKQNETRRVRSYFVLLLKNLLVDGWMRPFSESLAVFQTIITV
jgi:hypothetical protein